MKFNYACSLLFLFTISHILVLTHPVPVFDVSYLSYFKAIDCTRLIVLLFIFKLYLDNNKKNPYNLYFRSKFLNVIKSALSKIPDVSLNWIENTRLCSPRLLFYYETCPNEFKKTK